MSRGHVLESDDMLAWNDHRPVDSGTADHRDVLVDVLRDFARRIEVGYQLRYAAAMTIAGQGALVGDQ